jgi:hypothetical protein
MFWRSVVRLLGRFDNRDRWRFASMTGPRRGSAAGNALGGRRPSHRKGPRMADDELWKLARAIRKKHSPMVFDTPPPLSAYFPLSRAEARTATQNKSEKASAAPKGKKS